MIVKLLAGKSVMKYTNLKGFVTVIAIVSILLLGFVFLKISSGILLVDFDIFSLVLMCCLISVIIGLYISKMDLMVRHYRLFWLVGVLGTVLGTVLVVFSIGGGLMLFDIFVSMLECFIIGGIIGMGIGKGELVVKQFRFFGFVTVLGSVFLAIFFAVLADSTLYSRLLELLPFSGISSLFLTCFVWFCLLGGTFFLTTGVCGIGRKFFRGRQFSFSVVAVIFVPLFVLSCFI